MIEINLTGNIRQRFREIETLSRTIDSNIRGLNNSIRDLGNQSLSGLRNGLRGLTRGFSNTSTGAGGLASALGMLAGGGAIAGAIFAFKKLSNTLKTVMSDFSELEMGIAGIKKTTGLAGSELRSLTDQLTQISVTQNAMDITALHKIAESAGQLGITGKENIIEFTKTIRELSATSKLTAEQAGTEFAKLSLTLGEPIKEVKRLASAFTALASSTTTDEKKLVNYTQRLAGMGKTFGLTTQQIVGISATLADIGVSARLGTTAVSRLMTKMMTNTHRIAEVLRLDFDKFAYAIEHKPIQAINMFLERLGQLDKRNIAEALTEMRLSSVGATQTLIKLSRATDKLNKNIATSIKAYRENIALDKEFETVQNTLVGSTQRFNSAVKNMNYQLGKIFKPVVEKAYSLMASLANAIANTAKKLDWLINGERYAKEYMSKTNIEIRRQEQALKRLNDTQRDAKNMKEAIVRISKQYNSIMDKNSKQAKALENALKNLGREYNKTILKIQRLKKETSKPITQHVKVKTLPYKKIDYTPPEVRVRTNLVSNLTNISKSSFSLNTKETLEYKRVQMQKTTIYRKASQDRLDIEIATNAKALKQFEKYNIELYKINKQTLRRLKRDRIETFKQANIEIGDYLLEQSKGEYALLKERLKREYNEYKKLGINRVKLEKWYQTKLKHILEDEAKERNDRLVKETEERVKRELEKIEKQLEAYKQKGTGLINIQTQIKTILDKAGFESDLKGIFENVGKDFAKNLSESLTQSKVTQGLQNNILSIINSLAYGNTADDSKNEKYGKAIGGTAGAIAGYAFGGSIGGQIGETLGVILGGSIGRGWKKYITGKKSEWIKFNDDALKVFTKTSAHLNHKSIYRIKETQTEAITIQLNKVFKEFNNFYNVMGLQTRNFYRELAKKGRFKTKDLQENLDKEFIKGLSPNITKEDLQSVYNAWKQYTKDTKQSVSQAMIEELSKTSQIKQDIALYLANKDNDYTKAFKIKTMQDLSIISTIGKELNTTDIKQYQINLEKAIKQGKVLSKEEMIKWQILGKALLDYNQQFDNYKKSLIDERDRLKKLIADRKANNKQMAITSKEFMNFKDSLFSVVSSKNKQTPQLLNSSFDNMSLEKLRGVFNTYANNNADNFMGVIDTALARNRVIEAGYSVEMSKLTYGESKQLESLDKLEKRLRSIEQLLSEQGEILTATEKNTYISAQKR